MTIKEITALRKSGQLEEALKAAEEEFAINANNYTAGALFWCLNDLCKKENENDAISTIYERMKSLTEYCNGDDEFIYKSIASIERRLDPLGKEIKNALAVAKAGGNVDNLLKKLRNIFANDELSQNLYVDCGWLIYYALKNTPTNNPDKRKVLLLDYIRLELPRPELLHSLILAEAVKIEKNTPLQFRIRDFMSLWGWENLRDEDWEQYKTDNGNIVPSLVEKLISVFAKELKTDGVRSPYEFVNVVDKALEKYPNSQYMPFYKATVLQSQGKNAEALDYYSKLILKSPSKFYLWHQAAALVEDEDLKIALLCRAISVENDESFIGRCRLDLAKALINKGLFANAKYELDKYREFYASKCWALKPEYHDVARMLISDQISDDNQSLYNNSVKRADEFIYSAVPSVLAIKIADRLVEDRNRPGRRFVQWTLKTKTGVQSLRKPSKFGLDNNAPNGSIFEIKLQDGKIVWTGKSERNPLDEDWIKKLEGVIRLRTDRNGKTYSILNGAYINSKLLKDINDGDNVKVIALQQEDGRWSAISLKKL